jgi:hypothetical protein
MRHSNSIFSQLLSHIPRLTFQKIVDRHKGDKRAGSFNCWSQLSIMLYAQLCGRKSLRAMVLSWHNHRHLHYHLGVMPVTRSTLSDVNRDRPSGIYLELFFGLLDKLRGKMIASAEVVRLIDSTTIDLCKQQFGWATFRSGKAGVKVHTVYDPNAQVPTFFSITEASKHDKRAAEKMPLIDGATYVFDRAYNDYAWYHSMDQRDIRFVGRMKSNANFEVIENMKVSDSGVLEDQLIQLSSAKARRDCPVNLRRIRFVREEDGKTLTFITNDFKRTAGEVAELYKQRWQIELFFKWIKQNLKIKRFAGRSENAVKTQIIIAMISYLLLKLANQSVDSVLSLYQLATLLSITLMERRSIEELMLQKDPPKPPTNNPNQLALGIA